MLYHSKSSISMVRVPWERLPKPNVMSPFCYSSRKDDQPPEGQAQERSEKSQLEAGISEASNAVPEVPIEHEDWTTGDVYIM